MNIKLYHNHISEMKSLLGTTGQLTILMLTYLQTLHLQLNSLQGSREEAETRYRIPSLHQVAIDLF